MMITQRKTILIRLVSLLLIVCCMVSGTVSAAVQEPVQPMASDYLSKYSSHISAQGKGKIRIHFLASSNYTMDELGAESIVLYESSDNVNWIKVKTYQSENYVSMIAENDQDYTGYVTFYGVSGRYYKAYVCICANKGSGSDSRYIWTAVTQAT